MMSVLGGEEPDLPGSSDVVPKLTGNPEGSSDSYSLHKQGRSTASTYSPARDPKSMRDVHNSQRQREKMKRTVQDSYKRNTNSEDRVTDAKYSNTCSEQDVYSLKCEKKFRTEDMKYNIKYKDYEAEGSYDKYHLKHKGKYTNREAEKNHSREKRRKKSGRESEPRYTEHR